MNPIFSIVVPTYNRAAMLQECIQSVVGQSVPDWELIIVDDGSTDNTKDVVAGFQDEQIRYHFQEKAERSIARNKGIHFSKGKYICFLDDDDTLKENHLSVFYEYLAENSFPDIILRSGFERKWQDGSIKPAPNYSQKKHRNPVWFSLFNMCAVVTLCIPRKFLEQDEFPPSFPHWQDSHLILRLFAKYPMKQLDTHTYVYRIHPGMGSLQKLNEDELEQKAMINVAAMDDFFDNYGHLTAPFLPAHARNFLKAQKFLEYSILDLVYGGGKYHGSLLRKSLSLDVSFRHWKQYLSYIYHWLRFIFGVGKG